MQTAQDAKDSPQTAEIKVAQAPFDSGNPSADIILRSVKSNVDFYVFKTFLSYASPFFKQMFTLPQEGVEQEMKDGLLILPVEEDEETLDLLLRYCYPNWNAPQSKKISNLDSLILMLEASIKYDMEGVKEIIRAEIVAAPVITDQPIRVYAVALQYGLAHEAKLAARETLGLPRVGGDYVVELENITAGALHRLQSYHMRCSHVAVAAVKNLEEEQARRVTFTTQCSRCRGLKDMMVDYFARMKITMRETPSRAAVMNMDSVRGALTKASLCSDDCRDRAVRGMKKTSESIADEVQIITDAVSIPIHSGHDVHDRGLLPYLMDRSCWTLICDTSTRKLVK